MEKITLIKTVLSKSDFAYWSSILVNFGSALAVIPIAYIYLNDAELALWFSMSLLVSISFFSDFGASLSVIRLSQYARTGWAKLPDYGAMSSQIAYKKEKNVQLYQEISNTSFKQTLKSNFLFVIVGLLICFYFSEERAQSGISETTFYAISGLYLLNIPIQNLSIFFSGLIQSQQNVFAAKIIDTIGGAARIFFQLSIIYITEDLFLFCLAHLLGSAVGLFISSIYCFHKKYFYIDFKIKLKRDDLHKLSKYKNRQGLMAIGSFLILSSGPLIISNHPDPKLVSTFFLTAKIFAVLKNFSQVPILSVIPKLGILRASSELAKMLLFFKSRSRFSLSIFFLGSLFILPFSQNTHLIGMQENLLLEPNLLILMALIYLLELNHGNHAQLYLTKNHQPFLLPSLLSGIAILVLSLPASTYLGIFGLLLVQGIVQLAYNNWYPLYMNIRDLSTTRIF